MKPASITRIVCSSKSVYRADVIYALPQSACESASVNRTTTSYTAQVLPSTSSTLDLRRENVTITTISVCGSASSRAVSGGRSGGHHSSPRLYCFTPAQGTAPSNVFPSQLHKERFPPFAFSKRPHFSYQRII